MKISYAARSIFKNKIKQFIRNDFSSIITPILYKEKINIAIDYEINTSDTEDEIADTLIVEMGTFDIELRKVSLKRMEDKFYWLEFFYEENGGEVNYRSEFSLLSDSGIVQNKIFEVNNKKKLEDNLDEILKKTKNYKISKLYN
jgi:hypothetical protein